MKCNRDCFNCPYPDCLEDELTAADYRELAEIDREIINPKDRRAKKLAAQQKAWVDENREHYNDYMREYLREYRAGIRRRGRLTKNVYLAFEEVKQ